MESDRRYSRSTVTARTDGSMISFVETTEELWVHLKFLARSALCYLRVSSMIMQGYVIVNSVCSPGPPKLLNFKNSLVEYRINDHIEDMGGAESEPSQCAFHVVVDANGRGVESRFVTGFDIRVTCAVLSQLGINVLPPILSVYRVRNMIFHARISAMTFRDRNFMLHNMHYFDIQVREGVINCLVVNKTKLT
jgi:hypothetical protein